MADTAAGRGRLGAVVITHGLVAALAVGAVLVTVLGLVHGIDPTQVVPFGILLLATLAAGWLLAWRRPRNPLGWVLLGVAVIFAAGTAAGFAGDALADSAPDATRWLYWISGDQTNSWTWLPAVWALLVWMPLHFPDGRLPSTRWRPFSWFTIVFGLYATFVFATGIGEVHGIPNPVGIAAVRENSAVLLAVSTAGALVCFAGAVASLVVRYRRGGAVERAQLRWMVWGAAVAVVLLAVTWFLPAGPISDSLDAWILVCYALIPAAIVIAVLRYRLYEIDRILSRTAAYALVTLVIVALYAGVVVSAGWLLPDLPALGVALATLAAAAVFLPLLRWIRRRVDRVFDRAQYDAQRVVEAFGQRIRDGVDPHAASDDLVTAVESTLGPSTVGIWVRD